MGKRLIQQRRGRGSPRYRAPSHRFKVEVAYPTYSEDTLKGQVVEIFPDPARFAPLMRIMLEESFEEIIAIAPTGAKVGQWIEIGSGAIVDNGNVLPLKHIPEGTYVYNIESHPGMVENWSEPLGEQAM